ncbi:MAG: hypothetical protein ABSC08_19355, partial [Bryobacteraceae bacterium]
MWMCLSNGFLSIVVDKSDPTRLMVRARRKDDLLNVVGRDAEIIETPDRDYGWRTLIGREEFKAIVSRRLDSIDYCNFKDSVSDTDFHELYLEFWALHRGHHEQERRPSKSRRDRRSHLENTAGLCHEPQRTAFATTAEAAEFLRLSKAM